MQLKSLFLCNFRSYREAFFEFSPQANIIHGPNGCGKTTVLEAIYFFICGRSFRTASSSDLIKKGCSHFFIEANFVKHGLEQTLRISWDGKERKISHNRTNYPNFTSLLGLLKGIVFCPDDAALIKGAPSIRRHYLDLQAAQIDPLYVHHLSRFSRAMKQRNHLLKTKNTTAIETWEYEMALSGAYLTKQRRVAVEELQTLCQKLYFQLTHGQAEFKIGYRTSAPTVQLEELKHYFIQKYETLRRRELQVGFTLSGPHKDDLMIEIDGQEARVFGSEGQQRSCVAALRLAEWMRIKSHGDGIPLLLIDDIGTSLDEIRLECLLQEIQNLGQVYVTTTKDLKMKGSHLNPLEYSFQKV